MFSVQKGDVKQGLYNGGSGSCNLVKSEQQPIVTKSKKMRLEKNCPVKKLPSHNESGMVTIISVYPKSLLRKKIYGDFEKKPETPQKWCQNKIKCLPMASE